MKRPLPMSETITARDVEAEAEARQAAERQAANRGVRTTVSFRVQRDLLDRVRAFAKSHYMSATDVWIQAVVDYMDRRDHNDRVTRSGDVQGSREELI